MKLTKMRRKIMGISMFAVMGVSLFLTGANANTVKADEAEVSINETNFPDDTFRKYVEKFDTDKNHSFSNAELKAVIKIDVDAYGDPGNIENLKGVEYFTSLQYLNCVNNQLTSLDVGSNTALISLYCMGNQLTSLDVSMNKALRILVCGKNQLTSLDVSKNTSLTNLNCRNNQLTSLDLSKNTTLQELLCNDNQLTSLDLSVNTALFRVNCDGNHLASLDVSKIKKLDFFQCDNNTHNITFSAGNTFDMSTIPGMDVSKISHIIGGKIKGNILTVDSDVDEVTYTYDCGNNNSTEFKLAGKVAINGTNFPDAKFREYVKQFDTDGNGSFSSTELLAVTKIEVGGNPFNKYGDITSLKGIEHFPALEYIDCLNNQLTSLDVSSNTNLKELYCGNNRLASLDVRVNTALTNLICRSNQLTSLDVSSNTALTDLDCSDNQLTNLDVDGNTDLQCLYCLGNQLTSLDVSSNTALTDLDCSDNQLTNLDVDVNTALQCLYCVGNQLTSLDVSMNTALCYLDCGSNQLTSLDVRGNTALTDLDCSDNRLTSLDVSNNIALKYYFYCKNNIYPITLSAGNTFDMSTLPGMNVSRVSNLKGGKIKGNILTVASSVKEVTYTYDCGNGKTADFKLVVKKSISSAKVTLPKTSYTYTGSAITPTVTVTYGRKKLAAGTDYTVTYSNNKTVGTATVTITGKGNYAGTIKKTFKIVPASTTVKRLTNKTKGITIKWKKVPEAGGYIIYRSKNGGKFRKIKTISSGKTVSYTDKYAKTNGAKYQYKIISYKKVGKTSYKSAASKTKTIYRMSAPKIKELGGKSGKKIAVKWSKNKKATGYQIQYATNSKFKKAKTVTVKKASSVSKVITKLKKNKNYRVRVRAYKKVSGKKYYSAWSSKKSVKVRR